MDELEYYQWIVEDTAATLLKAVAVYALALTAFWLFIG